MNEKIRLDVLIKEQFNFSREYAKRLIIEENVSVNGIVLKKPSEKVSKTDKIDINENSLLKYVSRGGLKLEKAINEFKLELKGRVCADIGASTGGFTDCMLQNGAAKVFAVDVGSNQLVRSLREHPLVVSMENTNVKDITSESFGVKPDFVSIDVSFISLKKILNYVYNFLDENGEVVALIKPQFEVGRENIGKNGIVKNKKEHKRVLREIFLYCKEINFKIKSLTFSPITGGEGNIEYLIYLGKNAKSEEIDLFLLNDYIDEVAENAHTSLRRVK